MKLDLNSLLKEIYSWKTIINDKDVEIETFQNNIKQSEQCSETLQDSNNTLLQEIAHLNNVISTLHHSLSRAEELEVEKKTLSEERERLKSCLLDQEKTHQDEVTELRKAMEKLRLRHKEEIEKKFLETESKASSKLEDYSIKLKAKENYINDLESEISKLKKETSQELLRIKIEYEDRISRMKHQIAKSKGFHHNDDFKKTDIFRQKFIEKEKEAKEESLHLQKQIKELQEEVESLKYPRTTSEQSDVTSNYLTFSGEDINCFKDLHPSKKQKPNENFPDDDFVSLNAIAKSFPKHSTETVRHLKKKLFNLDMNYFDK